MGQEPKGPNKEKEASGVHITIDFFSASHFTVMTFVLPQQLLLPQGMDLSETRRQPIPFILSLSLCYGFTRVSASAHTFPRLDENEFQAATERNHNDII